MDNKPASFLNSVVKSFGPTERIFFYVFGAALLISGLTLGARANSLLLTEIPTHGGYFVEGAVGSPRFINPVLAISDIDKSVSLVVYSGLLKHAEGGGHTPDLAEHYSISEDGLVYTVKIRDDAFFHDGKPVTASDVQFTIEKMMDPIIKSPRRGAWENVAIQVGDEKNIRFVLKKPNSSFRENLTVGILPKHIWSKVSSEEFPFSQHNIEPVGSGPYKVSSVKYGSSGVPTLLTLKSFRKYTGGEPFISKLEIRFFQNEESMLKAFESGDVQAVAGLSPSTAVRLTERGYNVISNLMPRVFGAFLNQNQASVFLNAEIREALNESVDKERIVNEVLLGFGVPLDGPILNERNVWQNADSVSAQERIEKVRAQLEEKGWKANNDGVLSKKVKTGTQTLAFSIATSDAPELKKTVEILADTWNRLGAKVEIKVFESGDLNQNVIKPRKYDVLLFGEVVPGGSDLYTFWHSSQRIDPGLNIALYANITADKLLDDVRTATDPASETEKIDGISNEIKKDHPAIFIYAPKFIYAVSPKIKNINTGAILSQSERWSGIANWYIETDRVWSAFAQK